MARSWMFVLIYTLLIYTTIHSPNRYYSSKVNFSGLFNDDDIPNIKSIKQVYFQQELKIVLNFSMSVKL